MRRWLPWLGLALVLLAAASLLAGEDSAGSSAASAPTSSRSPAPDLEAADGGPSGMSAPRAAADARGPAAGAQPTAASAQPAAVADAGPAEGTTEQVATADDSFALRVEVVDPDGEPVEGVEVALLLTLEGSSGGNTVDEATTDAAGRAGLLASGDEQQAAWMAHVARVGGSVQYRVEALLPFETLALSPSSVELGPDPARSTPVRLEIPATGRLGVRVSLPDGAAAPDGCTVSCAIRPRGGDEAFRYGRLSASVARGRAELALVPLGRELRITAGGGGHRGGELVCAGPERAGELVEATVALGPPLPRIAGRLVGLDGTPLTPGRVEVEMLLVPRAAPPEAWQETARGYGTPVDDTGRFERELRVEPGPDDRLVVRVHEETRSSRGPVHRFARWDGVVEPGPGEVVDLGTLVLAPDADLRLLVTGTLRADDGERLKLPSVDAWTREGESGRWERLAEDRVAIAADGSFEVWTARPELPESFRLSAGARDRLGTSVTVEPGAHVDLVLEGAGSLSGSFEAADGAVLPLLVAWVRGEERSRSPDIFFGAFQVEGLPPGTYAVSAQGRDGSWVFGAVEGVEVRRGEVTRDPRLNPLDLGDACRLLRLRLVDAAGEPLGRAVAGLRDSAGKAHRQADEQGVVSVLVPSATTELEVSASSEGGHLRGVWTPAAGDEATLVLR